MVETAENGSRHDAPVFLQRPRPGWWMKIERAVVAAKGGGSVASCAKVILALEAGRQAVRSAATPGHSRSDTTIAAEILTLRRFRAVGREFEPNQRYRLTAAELAEVDWRAALEPNARIYDSPER